MATRVRLHVLPASEPELHVPLPLSLLEAAAAQATSIANDLDAALAAAEQRVWADSRSAALNEIGRARARVAAFRNDFIALTGDAPTRPHQAA